VIKEHYSQDFKTWSPEVLTGKIAIVCDGLYRMWVLKDRYNLEIDVSKMDAFAVPGPNGMTKKSNPCEICGHDRITELCHIIPRKDGGDDAPENLISLCANHHSLFDKHLLTREEWGTVDWGSKVDHVNKYAMNVRYRHHLMGWKYNFQIVPGCHCGSLDFVEDGNLLTCQKCGDSYDR
jgi:hypothetical protein